jgi:hypothetical protein
MERKEAAKIFSLVLFSVLLISFVAGVVSAANSVWDDVSSVINYDTVVKPFVEKVLGGVVGANSDEAIVSKLLLFFLLILLIDGVISRISIFAGRKWLCFAVSFIVSVLSIRFLATQQIITAVLLPYGAMGIAMTSIIPVAIFIAFIQQFNSGLVRRLGYIVFALLFVGLWWVRRADIGDLGYFYLAAVGILFISMLIDGTLRRWLNLAKVDTNKQKVNKTELNILEGEINKLQQSISTQSDSAKRKEELAQMKDLQKRMDDLMRV